MNCGISVESENETGGHFGRVEMELSVAMFLRRIR